MHEWKSTPAKKRCFACKKNKHAECIKHINDHAGDAQDFISVSCGCPCLGEVRGDQKLIDLVADLRQQLANADKAIKSSEGYAEALKGRSEGAYAILKDFFEKYIDDEGELLGLSKNRRWEKGVEDMHEKFLKLVEPEESEEDYGDEDDSSDYSRPPWAGL